MLKIMLDPGHGAGRAHNRGFVNVAGYTNCNEGDQNYIFCEKHLKPALERYGIQVGMTRIANQDPSFKDRGEAGRGYDLLISSHTNASQQGNATGIEIWDSTNPAESIPTLTNKITKVVSELLSIPNRGTRYRKALNGTNYYGILRNGLAKHNFIVEWAFHDNYSDAKKYLDNMGKIAETAAKVIAEHYNLTEKPIDKPIDKPVEPTSTGAEFIKQINYAIPNEPRIFNSVTIAQAILESNWGKSELAQKANNYFGIKSQTDWHGDFYRKVTNEEVNGKTVKIEANFRKYRNLKESVIDHDNFFVTPKWREKHYERVLKAKTPEEQCRALQSCGYATDSKYASKLLNLIVQHNLKEFDKVERRSKHYATRTFQVIETDIDNLYVQQLGGKTLRQVGAYGINGVFFDPSNTKSSKATWSIAINNGKPIGENANINHPQSHVKRATVLYGEGRLTVEHLNNISEAKRKIDFAVGGVGLIPYFDPDYEEVGNDVRALAFRTALAFKGKAVFLIISKERMYLHALKTAIERELDVDGAIALDGGGSTQMLYEDNVGAHTSRPLNNIIGIKEI